jgi:cell division protein FtsZ
MSVSLKPVVELNVGIIGLGGEGCSVIDSLDLSPTWSVECALWDACCNTLKAFSDAPPRQKKVLGLGISHGLGCVGQYELGRSVFLHEQEFCRSWLEGKDLVIIVGSLGGGFGGGFAPELARMVKNMEIPCLAFAKLPFSFEGRKRIEGAKQALGKLRELCLSVPMFEGDDYVGWIDDEGYAQEAVKQSTLECARAIGALLQMLFEEGLYEFNLETVRSTFELDVSKTLVISASSVGANAVDESLETVLSRIADKLPDKELKVDRLLVSVMGGKNLAVSEVNRIHRIIAERFNKPGKTFFGACINKDFEGLTLVVYLSIHLGKQFELVEFPTGSGMQPLESSGSKKDTKQKSKARELRQKKMLNKTESQEFFDSILNESNRGYFDDTPANSWNGIDLDVPTYIRRGIRVKT